MSQSSTLAPPAFLATDDYVPGAFRDLLSEAEGCLQKGFLTGGTACARRALDLLLTVGKAEGAAYEDRLQSLGEKHSISKMLTSILVQCGEASARENATLSAEVLQLFVVTMKAVVYELYVVGPERSLRLQHVSQLVKSVGRKTSERDAASHAGDGWETHGTPAVSTSSDDGLEQSRSGSPAAGSSQEPAERGRGYRRLSASSMR